VSARRANPRASRLVLFVDNRFQRRGVPTQRSFAQWAELALTSARAPRTAAAKARRHALPQINIAIMGTREARALNKQFRGRDYATNVLSFPFEPIAGDAGGLLGDIVICPPVVAREAREQRKALRHHFAHLVIHGVLHLLGYDHENDDDARNMENTERQLLESIGIPDPYADD
jgi:probable rRNA maturation factor